jgi:heptosyltransferase-2
MKIGILLPNWIGDVVMATPTLRAIRKHHGVDAEITGIMRPYVAQVLAGTSFLDRTVLFDRKSADATLHTPAVIRQLRQWQVDTMVLLPNSFRAAALAWRAGANQRVGYARDGRGWLLTTRLSPPREGRRLKPVSAIGYYLQLAYALGCAPEPRQMELATSPEDERGADQVWSNLGLDNVARVITFNTGSAVGSARSWPAEHFIELARRVVDDPDNAVLVICGPGERNAVGEIERRVNHPRVKSMASQDLSLGVAKACVRRSDLMVTTDSGPRHFAHAFNVPTVSLHGPIDPRWSESHHPQAIGLQYPIDCGPCGKTVCPLGHHRCMRDLSVDVVFAAVARQLAWSAGKQAA